MALAVRMALLRVRLVPYSRRTIDGGGPSRIGPWTTVGVVEESFHSHSPVLVDLGVAVLGRELHQSLGHDKSVVASLHVGGQGAEDLLLDACGSSERTLPRFPPTLGVLPVFTLFSPEHRGGPLAESRGDATLSVAHVRSSLFSPDAIASGGAGRGKAVFPSTARRGSEI